MLDPFDGETRAWAELRCRSIAGGCAGLPRHRRATRRSRAWSVSALETYLGCPFKFFAQHVLKLEEEPDDEEVMDPRRQGQFVHDVFETFFKAWQGAGHRRHHARRIWTSAREMFTAVVDRALERLPEAEAGLERTRLLGSPAAAGLGEAVFRMEAERPVAVVERLLEHRLDGEFTIATADGPRTIALRGKADRLDLLADGTFRLIDYKLGWPPNRARALQLPIYGLCAEQRLAGHRGRSWTLGEAAYLAFKGPKRVVPLFSSPADRAKVLADAQQRLADTIDAIERGEFPPTPDDVYRCETLQLRVGVPEGLCRRRLSRGCRSRTRARSMQLTSAVEARRRDLARPSHATPTPAAGRDLPDAAARRNAVDPAQNVVLEASAGTGKTRVLVERYVNLLRAGVEPDHILAITFTRKAAAEMRERIIERLREASRLSQFDAARWRDLKERLGDIAISTIDAFCLSLLREFPLEADVDPGFDLADETEVPRLIGESLDQALRICRGARARRRRRGAGVRAAGRAAPAQRHRGAARSAARRAAGAAPVSPEGAARSDGRDARASRPRRGCADVFGGVPRRPRRVSRRRSRAATRSSRCWRTTSGGLCGESRSGAPHFAGEPREGQAAFRALVDRLRAYFLTQEGGRAATSFAGTGFTADDCDSRRRVEAASREAAADRAARRARRSAASAAT